MKSENTLFMVLGKPWFSFIRTIKIALLSVFIIAGMQLPLRAQVQDSITQPSWWFGAVGGANFNFYRGSTQELNADLTVPVAFHDGFGIGVYLAPAIEYYRPNSLFGMMFQFGYDSRQGDFDEILTPCNCPTDLFTKLSYITVEPSLRFAPFKSNFYIYAGPRGAYNIDKSFVYQQKINPDYPEQVQSPEVTGDFSNVNQILISGQIGAGIDIPLLAENKKTQLMLSPFVSFQPYFGQSARSIETWTTTTLRAGTSLKFGAGRKTSPKKEPEVLVPEEPIVSIVNVEDSVSFVVNAPENIPAERTVREIFPIINYVFFDIGSTEIPNRYVMINKDQVKEFKEEQVELFTPTNLSGRSDRQMIVYYNILNILGDRMNKNPNSNIKLIGSSEKGPADGSEMAASIKNYLVTIFAISPSRISTEGRDKPKLPSEQPGSTDHVALLREGDRRVSIESDSPALLMEFQSGPNAPLKPVQIKAVQEAPVDSYVSFKNDGASESYTSWTIEIADEQGKIQQFGPYTQDVVAIPGKAILGERPEGNYKVKMIGTTKNGKTVVKESKPVRMVLWTPPVTDEVMRYSVTYGFDNSKVIDMYEKYLTEVVTPKIPIGGKVIIHGYTDIIGSTSYNQKLSAARAEDVKTIIQKALANAGRTDVSFNAYGFGEDPKLTQFENTFPEERFYNRTVIIDIIPR